MTYGPSKHLSSLYYNKISQLALVIRAGLGLYWQMSSQQSYQTVASAYSEVWIWPLVLLKVPASLSVSQRQCICCTTPVPIKVWRALQRSTFTFGHIPVCAVRGLCSSVLAILLISLLCWNSKIYICLNSKNDWDYLNYIESDQKLHPLVENINVVYF